MFSTDTEKNQLFDLFDYWLPVSLLLSFFIFFSLYFIFVASILLFESILLVNILSQDTERKSGLLARRLLR